MRRLSISSSNSTVKDRASDDVWWKKKRDIDISDFQKYYRMCIRDKLDKDENGEPSNRMYFSDVPRLLEAYQQWAFQRVKMKKYRNKDSKLPAVSRICPGLI